MDEITYLSFQYIDSSGAQKRRSLDVSRYPRLAAIVQDVDSIDSGTLQAALVVEFDDVVEVVECVGWLSKSLRWIELVSANG